MTKDQRDKIIILTRQNYQLLGCEFNEEDVNELVEYLYESSHGDEIRCIESALQAHNLYNNDSLDINDFFDWHG